MDGRREGGARLLGLRPHRVHEPEQVRGARAPGRGLVDRLELLARVVALARRDEDLGLQEHRIDVVGPGLDELAHGGLGLARATGLHQHPDALEREVAILGRGGQRFLVAPGRRRQRTAGELEVAAQAQHGGLPALARAFDRADRVDHRMRTTELSGADRRAHADDEQTGMTRVGRERGVDRRELGARIDRCARGMTQHERADVVGSRGEHGVGLGDRLGGP